MKTPILVLRAFAAPFLAAVLAACVVAPRAPLMSPLEAGGGYGYSERQLSGDRFEVNYLGPRMRSSVRRANREADTERARNLAYDLALWRAAEVSLQNGFPAFLVEDKRTDIEVEIVDEALYFPYHDAFDDHGLYHSHAFHFYDARYGFRRVRLQARATLIVVLLKRPRAGAFDAAATAESLKRKHPDALAVSQN